MSLAINLAHVFFTGPLFVYVGLFRPTHPLFYRALLVLGILLLVYFVYRVTQVPITSPYQVWLMLHLFAFIPLLIWVGLKGPATPGIVFSLLTAIGCAAIGLHAIRLAQRAGLLPPPKPHPSH